MSAKSSFVAVTPELDSVFSKLSSYKMSTSLSDTRRARRSAGESETSVGNAPLSSMPSPPQSPYQRVEPLPDYSSKQPLFPAESTESTESADKPAASASTEASSKDSINRSAALEINSWKGLQSNPRMFYKMHRTFMKFYSDAVSEQHKKRKLAADAEAAAEAAEEKKRKKRAKEEAKEEQKRQELKEKHLEALAESEKSTPAPDVSAAMVQFKGGLSTPCTPSRAISPQAAPAVVEKSPCTPPAKIRKTKSSTNVRNKATPSPSPAKADSAKAEAQPEAATPQPEPVFVPNDSTLPTIGMPLPADFESYIPATSSSHYGTTGNEVHDASYNELEDFAPSPSTLPNNVKCLKVEWKGQPMDLSKDPYVHLLHPAEVYLASILRLPCNVYLDSKRRFFAEKVRRLRNDLPFRRTDAQKSCRIDVNKASRLFTAYEKVGWLNDDMFTKFLKK